MIVTRLISGLGNQLFQYAVGRQLSLANATTLALDTSFFAAQNLRSYKLDRYNIQAELATPAQVNSLLHLHKTHALSGKLYRRLMQLLPKYRRHYFVEAEWWVYEPDLLKVVDNTYLDGYWQHYRYFEHLDKQVLQELTLKDAYPAEAQPLLARIATDEAAVSLHIRRGDYLSDANAHSLMGVLPLEYYQKAIAYLKTQVANPTFYIFSDDLAWAGEHLAGIGPAVLVDVAGGSLEHIELDLMSKCRHNIIANSSFSWWGAFLNRNPTKVVVAPAQWVRPPDINAKIKLQFPSWVQM